jgi:hypothetical protein
MRCELRCCLQTVVLRNCVCSSYYKACYTALCQRKLIRPEPINSVKESSNSQILVEYCVVKIKYVQQEGEETRIHRSTHVSQINSFRLFITHWAWCSGISYTKLNSQQTWKAYVIALRLILNKYNRNISNKCCRPYCDAHCWSGRNALRWTAFEKINKVKFRFLINHGLFLSIPALNRITFSRVDTRNNKSLRNS